MLSNCPEQHQLKSFAVGAVADADFEDIAAHVEQCAGCNAALEALEGDDMLVSVLQGLNADRAALADPPPHNVMASARSAARSGATSSNITLDPGRRYARRLAEGPCFLGRFELQAELGNG